MHLAFLLDKKAYVGNVALKIDISKAFDTLHWPFLRSVLEKFGFDPKFCKWNDVILHSVYFIWESMENKLDYSLVRMG